MHSDLQLYKSKLKDPVNPSVIVRIEALSNYSKLYFLSGKTMVVAKLIAFFEEKLSADNFIRIHRSHLINFEYVEEVAVCQSKVVLLNGDHLKIARRKMHLVRGAKNKKHTTIF